jgi:hypothetical protein
MRDAAKSTGSSGRRLEEVKGDIVLGDSSGTGTPSGL